MSVVNAVVQGVFLGGLYALFACGLSLLFGVMRIINLAHGDIAVLTYNVVNYQRQPDGTERPTTRWNSTAIFKRAGGRWRTIHSHFSYTKPEWK